jgi:hypothetical protein
MKLTNMKLDKSDREESKPAEMSPDMPVYPWGLQVRLDEAALDKLGLDTLPAVDSERLLIAKVKVVSVSSNEHSAADGSKKHKHKSVELQICEMALDDVPAEKSASDSLYPKG